MKLYPYGKIHADHRRTLVPFNPGDGFPQENRELKIISIPEEGEEQRLGNHAHPYEEGFMLVRGSARVITWTQERGQEETELRAPALFAFEPHEEHVVIGSPGMVLIGFMPVEFVLEHHLPAMHLDLNA